MLLHKHQIDLFAPVAAELVGVFRRGKGESVPAKRKTAEITELCGGFHLLPKAEGLDIGDDAPTVQGVNGGCKRRLPTVRNAVADLFEKSPL